MIGAWLAFAVLLSLAIALVVVAARKMKDFGYLVRAVGRVCLKGEGLKFFAFLGATGAGVALTAYLVWNTAYLHAKDRPDNVFVLAVGSMVLLGLTQLSLHRLLGAKQAIELELWKIKAKINQGDE